MTRCSGELVVHVDGVVAWCTAGCRPASGEAALSEHRWYAPCQVAGGEACPRCASLDSVSGGVAFSPGVFGPIDLEWVDKVVQLATGMGS